MPESKFIFDLKNEHFIVITRSDYKINMAKLEFDNISSFFV